MDNDLTAWIRLTLARGIGPIGARKLLAAFGSAEAIFKASRFSLAAIVGERCASALAQKPDERRLAQAIDWLAAPGRSLITLADSTYPPRLLTIPDPPPALYVSGASELLTAPSIAIVGSRSATRQGLLDAERFAQALSRAGVTVVSGLALGIDAAAHRGALGQRGSTIAVLGTGADVAYPSMHGKLADQIATSGALVSEFPLGTAPVAGNFPRRNRVISGLALGCLVVEAALDSGSLITARLAAEQGREVFALPGSIHSPLSKGCHRLIREGAKLVEDIEHLLEELPIERGPRATVEASTPTATPDAERLFVHMGYDPIDIDMLCKRAGLTVDVVSAMLLAMELEGSVASLPGGRYQRLS